MNNSFGTRPKSGIPVSQPSVGPSAPSGGSWTVRPNWTVTTEDSMDFKASLDLRGFVSDFMKGLIEIENEAAEKALIRWLQSRGYEVTRKGEFK